MTIKEIEKCVAENFPDLIVKYARWNKHEVHWYHKDYPECELFYTGTGFGDSCIRIFLPFRFVNKNKVVDTSYRIKYLNSPILPVNEDANMIPYCLDDYRHWKIREISEMTLKFYLIDLQQQYLKVKNEILRTTESKCQETCKG